MKINVWCLFLAILAVVDDVVLTSPLLDSKIINGKEFQRETVKYVASVRRGFYHICSGCLISYAAVLTTSHCAYKIGHLGIILENETEYSVFIAKTEFQITKITFYQGYHRTHSVRSSGCDLATITINRVLDCNLIPDDIHSIDVSDKFIETGTRLEIFGWTRIFLSEKMPDYGLRIVEIEIIDHNHGAFLIGSTGVKRSEVMCGRLKKNDQRIEDMDTGSPVIFNNTLVGIVKFLSNSTGNPAFIIRATQLKVCAKNAERGQNID